MITKEPTDGGDVGDGDKLTVGDTVGVGDGDTNGDGDTEMVGDKEISGELDTIAFFGVGDGDTVVLGDNVTNADGDILGDTDTVGDNVTNLCFVTMGVTSGISVEDGDSWLLIVAARSCVSPCRTNTTVNTRVIAAIPRVRTRIFTMSS